MKNYLILFLFFLMGVETIDAQTAVKLQRSICRSYLLLLFSCFLPLASFFFPL